MLPRSNGSGQWKRTGGGVVELEELDETLLETRVHWEELVPSTLAPLELSDPFVLLSLPSWLFLIVNSFFTTLDASTSTSIESAASAARSANLSIFPSSSFA